jgi:hypothetical protein
MDESTRNNLRQLLPALRALNDSVEKSYVTSTFQYAGDMLVKSYQKLYAKLREVLPEDFFLEALGLELPEGATDEQKVTQVRVAVSQLTSYMRRLLEQEEGEAFVGFSRQFGRQFGDLGRELQQEIMEKTRQTLARAMGNLDIGVKVKHKRGQDLRGAEMRGANLEGENFTGADLSEAHLEEAHLEDANLSGATLARANLHAAHASDANFSGAELPEANLSVAVGGYEPSGRPPTPICTASIPATPPTGRRCRRSICQSKLNDANFSGALTRLLRAISADDANFSGARMRRLT